MANLHALHLHHIFGRIARGCKPVDGQEMQAPIKGA
jgi:hypothetical protein